MNKVLPSILQISAVVFLKANVAVDLSNWLIGPRFCRRDKIFPLDFCGIIDVSSLKIDVELWKFVWIKSHLKFLNSFIECTASIYFELLGICNPH